MAELLGVTIPLWVNVVLESYDLKMIPVDYLAKKPVRHAEKACFGVMMYNYRNIIPKLVWFQELLKYKGMFGMTYINQRCK